jgi:cyclase
MLKKRVVATVVVKDGIVVQSINFKKYLPVGKPPIALEFLNQWGIDEIILIDISASKNNKEPNYSMVAKASEKCFVPLTVGGGITKLEHIQKLMQCGADKISLNTAAINQPELISSASHIFGNQCIVVSVDAIKIDKEYRVYNYLINKSIEISPADFVKKVVDLGAGEILINSVDRDGSYLGFDFDLINSVCAEVNVPVICSGGAKNANDFIQVFQKTNVSAASAANFFNFFEHSVNITKSGIKRKIDVRLETFTDYAKNSFDENYRLVKKTDQELEEMLFMRIEKEVI